MCTAVSASFFVLGFIFGGDDGLNLTILIFSSDAKYSRPELQIYPDGIMGDFGQDWLICTDLVLVN